MADILQNAAVWLGGMFQKHASRPMVYCRGAVRIEMMGTLDRPAEVRDETAPGGMVTTEHSDRDIVLAAAAIAELTIPHPLDGDKIEVPLAYGSTEIYEVLPIAGRKSWNPCDAEGTYLKLHTKKVALQ